MKRFVIVVGCALLLEACSSATPEPERDRTETLPEQTHGGHHHHHGGGMPLRFDKAEEWTKVFDDPERDAWQRPAEVVTLLAISPGMTVADLGAGTGYFLPHLSRAVGPSGKALGLDVEDDMVRFMTERAAKEGFANVEAKKVPFDAPGLASSSVDRILIVDTWHHIESRPEYAKKLAAALRPDGFVAIVDFTMETEKGPPKNHRVAPEAAMKDLEAGGLSVKLAEETLPDQYVVIGRRTGGPPK
ncbi:MAG: methyltransferase domain-containing protein [Polyangiaceae bacterium]|nr:methyltransferase domain-containing protein [Polyangiaceae bacterium]